MVATHNGRGVDGGVTPPLNSDGRYSNGFHRDSPALYASGGNDYSDFHHNSGNSHQASQLEHARYQHHPIGREDQSCAGGAMGRGSGGSSQLPGFARNSDGGLDDRERKGLGRGSSREGRSAMDCVRRDPRHPMKN